MTTRASVNTFDAAIRLFYETRAEGIAKGLVDDLYALAPPVAPAHIENEADAPGVPLQEAENAVEGNAPHVPAQPLSRQIPKMRYNCYINKDQR